MNISPDARTCYPVYPMKSVDTLQNLGKLYTAVQADMRQRKGDKH